jgi:hypothetical protein
MPAAYLVDVEPRGADVRQPLLRILLETPPQQPSNWGRRAGRQRGQVGLAREH